MTEKEKMLAGQVYSAIDKELLKELIEGEDKHHPLSDEKLCEELTKRGYNVARRTVAKYRERLKFPVARLRKEM